MDRLAEHSVIVNIFGEEYPITGFSDPAYMRRVAEFVDGRMRRVAQTSRSKARDKVAVLTALSIASELLEKSEDLGSLRHTVDNRLTDLLGRLDAALDPHEQPLDGSR